MPTRETELLRLRAAAELERRKRLGASFQSFASYVNPLYQSYRHSIRIGNALDRVDRGEIKRLMLFLPPQFGKSLEVSRLFPAYYLYKHSDNTVGLASYVADLAHGLSRDARDNYISSGRPINPDVSATREWETYEGGGMWSAGSGGPITGKGFDLGIIDDPYKDMADAMSSAIKESVRMWYRNVWQTRKRRGCAEIIVQTRWTRDDLCGWLLEEENHNPQHWHIIVFPAIKDSIPFEFPSTCTVEEDDRQPGEVLCEELHPLNEIEVTRILQGERFFSAMYQQRPTMLGGEIWKESWFKEINAADLPKLHSDGTDWDTAYTENEENAASAFIRSAVDDVGNMYVLDLGFEWFEFPAMIEWMKNQKAPHYIEKKASGKSATQTLVNNGIAAIEVEVSGDKEQRTILATPFVERGNVFIVSGLKDKLLNDPRQGILPFPKGQFRDLNDTFVQAVNRHFKKTRGMQILTSTDRVAEEMRAEE